MSPPPPATAPAHSRRKSEGAGRRVPEKPGSCPTASTASRNGKHAKSAQVTADCCPPTRGRGRRPPRLYPPVRLGARVGQVQGATRSNSGQDQSLPELPDSVRPLNMPDPNPNRTPAKAAPATGVGEASAAFPTVNEGAEVGVLHVDGRIVSADLFLLRSSVRRGGHDERIPARCCPGGSTPSAGGRRAGARGRGPTCAVGSGGPGAQAPFLGGPYGAGYVGAYRAAGIRADRPAGLERDRGRRRAARGRDAGVVPGRGVARAGRAGDVARG